MPLKEFCLNCNKKKIIFFGLFVEKKVQKGPYLFVIYIFETMCKEQMNVSLMNKIRNFFKKKIPLGMVHFSVFFILFWV